MKSTKLCVIIIMCVLLISILLFSISCAQKEQGDGEEGEHALGEAAENAPDEEGEHAPGEAAENAPEEGEHGRGEEGERSRGEEGEHARGEEGEKGDSEGEESGIRYTLNETCDELRKGVQLHLTYHKSSSTFIGTIKNVSHETAKKVRVEVHLSNKKELGPTKPVDLAPGKQASVKLSAEGQSFTWWTAHAEVGSSEHKRDS